MRAHYLGHLRGLGKEIVQGAYQNCSYLVPNGWSTTALTTAGGQTEVVRVVQ